ncbi:MAG: hypothetical protein C0P76_014705 [Acidimicrobiia bacterium]
MNVTQILAGQSSTITVTAYADGVPSSEGTPTCKIIDIDGRIVDEPAASPIPGQPGRWTIKVGPFSHVAQYRARLEFSPEFTVDAAGIEVVGNFLFGIHDARTFQDGKLADETQFPDAMIAAERARIADWLEARTGRSWVPRFRRVTLVPNGRHTISLLDAVGDQGPSGGEGHLRDINRIIAINGEPVDPDSVDVDGWQVTWWDGRFQASAGKRRVTIDYEYGVPHLRGGVDRIALLELADRLPTSRLNRAATSSSDDLGSYGWEPQNNGRPSRIPEVNEWCRQEDRRFVVA